MTGNPAGTTAAAAAPWRRPGTLGELRAALDAFAGWDALERARRAPELIEAAKAVLAGERAVAMGEAKAQGLGATALARALGITRQKVYDAIARTPAGRGAAGDDATAAAVDVSGYRLLYDGGEQAWLLFAGDRVIADHDGLSAGATGAAAACSWAAGVLVDEGAGPVAWQPTDADADEYRARPVDGPGHNRTDLEG